MRVNESMAFLGELFQSICIKENYKSKSGSNALLPLLRKLGTMIMSSFKIY